MSKRLQVILDDAEFENLQQAARTEGTTVSEWVRRALRRSHDSVPRADLDAKLAVLRAATRHEFPTADIDEMQAHIEHGYRS